MTISEQLISHHGCLPYLGKGVFIAPGSFLIGDIQMGAHSSIWYGCVLRADVNIIRIGDSVNIQDGTVIHVAHDGKGTHIGDRVTVGHMALLHECVVEDDAFIGMKACIMDGAVIESSAMVAAGALVAPGKRVCSGELWAGVPARRVRSLSDEDKKMFQDSAHHYVALARSYLEKTS